MQEMTFNEKRAFAQGLSWVLAQPNFEKVMLNLEELRDLSVNQGHPQEAEVLIGLCERRGEVDELCGRVRKGYGIGFERIEKASKGIPFY